jgi:hypothetical protein
LESITAVALCLIRLIAGMRNDTGESMLSALTRIGTSSSNKRKGGSSRQFLRNYQLHATGTMPDLRIRAFDYHRSMQALPNRCSAEECAFDIVSVDRVRGGDWVHDLLFTVN